MKTTDERIVELSDGSLKRRQIAEKLNKEGFKTKAGLEISPNWLASRISFLKVKGEFKTRKGVKLRNKKSKMINIPIEEPKSGKLIVVMGDFSEVQKLIGGML